VYDLGGGTFDVTLVRIGPADVTVLGTDGDHELGGKDWDDAVARYVVGRFEQEYGFNPLNAPETSGEVTVRCEEAKRPLTRATTVTVAVDAGGFRGRYDLTRDTFEALTAGLLGRTARLCEQVRRDAGGDRLGQHERRQLLDDRRGFAQRPAAGAQVRHGQVAGPAWT